jgi:carboxypeptidase Taq
MKQKKSPYHELHELSKTCSAYQSIQYLLEWDQETYMPSQAADFRATQCALIAGHGHKLRTSPKFSQLLKQLINLESGQISDPSLSDPQKAALREWRRDFMKAVKLPISFVKTMALTSSQACHAWSLAKKESNFKAFAPFLEKIVKLNQKKAKLLGYTDHPYDALLDLYEPDMTSHRLTQLFDRLKIALSSLVKKTTGPIDNRFLKQEFSPEVQMQFGKKLLRSMGFNPESSRLDISSHPFCCPISPYDTRMTTRIHSEDLMSNIFSVIHEGGHGLYHQGLPIESFGSPLAESVSLGIDESQSRFWETRIGRSLPFWKYFYPELQQAFPQLKAVTLEQFYPAINIVQPSFIRVEADEVTYGLHVIIRFEIEKALIEGSLRVKDLPKVWNEKMHDYLGITPANDAQGCLQDIHWSLGMMGYFPTYVLGNLYASQFFTQFEKAHPDWQARVAKGDLAFINQWLHTHIHQWGRHYTPDELAERITGRPLDETAFVNYLTEKYQAIYRF